MTYSPYFTFPQASGLLPSRAIYTLYMFMSARATRSGLQSRAIEYVRIAHTFGLKDAISIGMEKACMTVWEFEDYSSQGFVNICKDLRLRICTATDEMVLDVDKQLRQESARVRAQFEIGSSVRIFIATPNGNSYEHFKAGDFHYHASMPTLGKAMHKMGGFLLHYSQKFSCRVYINTTLIEAMKADVITLTKSPIQIGSTSDGKLVYAHSLNI